MGRGTKPAPVGAIGNPLRLDSLEASPGSRAVLDKIQADRVNERARLALLPSPDEIESRRWREPENHRPTVSIPISPALRTLAKQQRKSPQVIADEAVKKWVRDEMRTVKELEVMKACHRASMIMYEKGGRMPSYNIFTDKKTGLEMKGDVGELRVRLNSVFAMGLSPEEEGRRPKVAYNRERPDIVSKATKIIDDLFTREFPNAPRDFW